MTAKPYEIIEGDCLATMRGMDADSVDAVVTDPPYFRVKEEPWDRQWDSAEGFLAWMGELCAEWERILRPNGSLYVFASPRMAAQVEVEISKQFCVLNRIRWIKEAGWHNKAKKETLRSFLSPWEEVIFAEHYGFLFEPLRAYLEQERNRAGFLSTEAIDSKWQTMRGSKGGMAGHWFGRSQWALPTRENYEWLRGILNHNGGDFLRREYEDLRREYEDLRRPFSVSADVPYTDVWTFPTVQAYPGKHPCEKPVDMLEHIITASTRPGALVLDCFAGSGSTGVACVKTGRRFIGIEKDSRHAAQARARIQGAESQPDLFTLAEVAE